MVQSGLVQSRLVEPVQLNYSRFVALPVPGLGSTERIPFVNKELDLASAALTPEDYFVLTRVDGRTSLGELLLISGFPEHQGVAILVRLYLAGAIYFDGEAPQRHVQPPPRPPAPPPPRPSIDARLLAEDVELTDEQKRAILEKHASIQGASHFAVLGVAAEADARALKAAYRRISMDFHPDRFFGKRLGSYQALLGEIFALATTALEVLSDPARRAEALGCSPAADPQALFDDACHHEAIGDLERAMFEFAAVVATDPKPNYLRRAAEVALRAQELRVAEEYAKKAAELDPQNAAAHRILAKVLRALGRIAEARRALELATRLDPGNPHLARELLQLVENGDSGG